MKKRSISEATGSSGAGKFKVPIVLSPQLWTNDQVGPFTEPVYHYKNAELAYEEADGDFKESPAERKRIERKTDKVAEIDMYLKKFYTGQNDEEGSNIADVESPKSVTDKVTNIQENMIKEDLGVWFGTKKKKKGSAQSQGPWVNICRKKEGGGHPPCGRSEAESKGYPKCRARSVAAKMTDSQKKSACSQKRKAEKTHSKTGTGNKPKMVSYKPKNEGLKEIILKVLKENF